MNAPVVRISSIEIKNIKSVEYGKIDLSKKTQLPPVAEKKTEDREIVKQEEAAYHEYVESKKEEAKKPSISSVDASSQAAMVKDLFGGKFIN